MSRSSPDTDADILRHLVIDLADEDTARALLKIKFDKAAIRETRQFLLMNNRGMISPPERIRLEWYLRVGKILDVLHAKARLILKQANQ